MGYNPKIVFSEEQLERAQIMRAQGSTWTAIARYFGLASMHPLRAALDPKYRALRNAAERFNKKFRDKGRPVYEPSQRPRDRFREPPSMAALEEFRSIRDLPRSITAEFFGDPLPGRSALDKRNAAR